MSDQPRRDRGQHHASEKLPGYTGRNMLNPAFIRTIGLQPGQPMSWHAFRCTWRLAAILFLSMAGLAPAAFGEDPYLAVRTTAAGAVNYVRLSEIEALADVSPSHCMLILSNGEEIRVFQKCSSHAAALQSKSLVSFPNEFGAVFVSPAFIFDMLSTSNSGCRLNLRNRRFVPVSQSCESVHQALPHE